MEIFDNRYERSLMVLGIDAMAKIRNSSVAVFGLGGVGGPAAEALARAGVGHLHLIDGDKVSLSNINRQIIAFESTVGIFKTLVMKDRIRDIDPYTAVTTYEEFLTPRNFDFISLDGISYIIDAIDSVSAKICLAELAYQKKIPLISSMGMGNKTDPAAIEVADIFSTKVCPLARIIRKELRARDIPSLKVVFSAEEPRKTPSGKRIPGSVSFVPPVAGYILAGEVIRHIAGL